MRFKQKVKRGLSLFLVAVLFATATIANPALAGALEKSTAKIDVWDFGGAQESDTTKYNNNISGAFWDSCSNVAADGKFLSGTTTIGDLTITHNANDRLFSSSSSKNYGTNALATTAFDDGYTAGGMYYCNGTGGDNRRHITVANVKAGDKIVVYMASSNAAEGILYFQYMGEDATQKDAQDYTNKGAKHEFVAQYSGTYKIWTDASAGKPIYNRVVRIPSVSVSGTIDLGSTGISGYAVKFVNDATGVETEATLNGTTFTASLTAGESYTATLTGATGFGFTNATKKVSITVDEVFTGKSNVALVVEAKSTYTYSGKVTGFAADYNISDLKLTLQAPEESLCEDVTVSIPADGSFSVVLEPDVEYTAVLTGVNDYEIVSGGTVNDNKNVTADITVALKAKYAVSGGFLDLPGSVAVKDITFTNLEDNYTYAGTVSADGYTGSLRAGSYAVAVTVDGYKTSTHLVVVDKDVKKDLLFVSTSSAGSVEWAADIYVGYEDKGSLNYATVKEAVAACAAMNPTSEDKRITVHIAPGTYREQIMINTPYISFVNDTDEEVLLTWYYGIGYKYYSADSTGYYNPENAYDKFDKNIVSTWGCSTYVGSKATAFKADGITFEASFNRYITDEEIADGVEVSGLESIRFERKYGADVTSKAATERATAMAVYADNVEFTNCTFLGSQDTLFTGNSAAYGYYKNCYIEGNTDYIFGSNNAVFDGCVLNWYGYSTGSVGGYVTAHKPVEGTTLGYLFRNCVITGDSKLTVTEGYLGRPWGANAMVTFLNTKVTGDLITSVGWKDMSGAKPENANFKEYGTVKTDGTAVDTSGRITGVITKAQADAIDVNAFLGSTTPSAFVKEDATVSFATKPYVVDNGDINAPYPGHTLTVGYSLGTANDANDASVIRWYIVGADGTETLVKSTTAVADKSYTITSDAVGKQIKVVVVPEVFSGNTAAAASYTVEATVRDGFEDPSGEITDVTLGNGVNIFLAGDSTVKDYSANGMYMGGKAQSEGSWGEYLQSLFDEDVVKIQNYANGGRSTRNFINEGSLDKIAANIKAGDYLFIQFGHNDCANGTGYLEDRYVPLGTPDANGIFPVTAGKEVATPSSLTAKYGDTFYSYDCGGTFKWYLLQYIEVARKAGATPVLVTPVARMYYTVDGTIKTHHDSTDTTTGTYVSSNNAYVEAYKQLAKEENVLLIDAFELTKTMYEEAYKADPNASNGVSEYGSQSMAPGDKTHSNKLGGFVSALLMGQAIQKLDLNISKVVNMPSQVAGENTSGQQMFAVNGKNVLSAYTVDGANADYWSTYGQKLIDEIGAVNAELNKPADDDNTGDSGNTGDDNTGDDNTGDDSTGSVTDSTVSEDIKDIILEDANDSVVEKIEDSEYTEEEKQAITAGATVTVTVTVDNISDTVSDSDKDAVKSGILADEALNDSKVVVGAYIDIELIKKVGNCAETAVEATKAPIKVAIQLPETLINSDSKVSRTYKVVRVHNGETAVLDATFDKETGKLTFATDKFSTYAVVYTDVIIETGEGENTGDNTPVAMFMMLALVSMGALSALYFTKKRRINEN